MFWCRGYAGASLDDISAATNMTRPSLYAAFGNKKSIYRKAITKFSREFLGGLDKVLFAGISLEDDLVNFYLEALKTYMSAESGPLGCPVICTATIEASVDQEIRQDLMNALDGIDSLLTRRFLQAHNERRQHKSAVPESLGRVAGALLHSLAVRVRARQTGFKMEDFIKDSVAQILKY